MKRLILFLILATASLGWSQTLINGSRVIAGTWNYCADAGSTDAYACSLSPAITAYATGGRYTFKAATANTGGATLALNGLTAIALVKYVGGVAQALADNDIRAGAIVEVLYDGTNFQVVSLLGNAAPAYTLPTAAAGTLGGIRIGTGLSIDGDGVVTASGTSVACDPSNIEHFCIVEEFFGGSSSTSYIGTHGWKWATVSSGTTANVGVGGGNAITQHPGLIYIQSTTSANSGGVLTAGNPTSISIVNLADLMAEEWEIAWVFKLDSITDVRVHLGLSEDGTALSPATNNATFQLRYDTDAAFGDGSKNTTGSWVAQFCGYGGATTCGDTDGVYAVMNITPDTNWHRGRIYRSGTTINFQIDGNTAKTMCASGCDMTTPSPTSSTADGLAPWAAFGVSGTTQRKILIDRAHFYMTGLSRY